MQTVLQQTYARPYSQQLEKSSTWAQFITWCESQQESRFLWLGIGVAAHACFLTPLTVAIIMLTGNSMFFWAFAIAAMAMTLVTNLAALPTKITIPVFFFSILLDAALIVLSFAL